ncbi:polysaccharide biosynthesis/export family protein [Xanthomarina spongicola]|uniref:Polysaccharide export outer membrane protein n=1 Tax=Xanthomarina spongicola TaxID=570520 RepID=A0A316DPG9_9FLAO|nr:polysaccharide biosynthesis/export family protein [Xanthomarina spongicola]PWK19971.1 polysaccharide export outer membrane protein [Xanthomarina spongicola]
MKTSTIIVKRTKQILHKVIIINIILVFSSCVSSKEIIYFQDEPLNSLSTVNFNSDIVYKPNDLLTINVSALDPETVKPFNLPVITNSISSLRPQGDIKMQTYIVDLNGNIEFPVLGSIKIGGLNRFQATQMLKERISEYVTDPIINIRVTNFTITVIGEVNGPGTYTIEDERISLLEAIGLAGDLTIHGKRENVFLIREQDGVKRFTKFDLTSINVINSPSFYLEQNDVVYVEPNKAKIRSASYNQNYIVIISAIGTLATIAAILVK